MRSKSNLIAHMVLIPAFQATVHDWPCMHCLRLLACQTHVRDKLFHTSAATSFENLFVLIGLQHVANY